ncbi:MAG: 3-dehydroquinate synthase [Clostridia bacterium]
MRTLTVATARPYDVEIGGGLIDSAGDICGCLDARRSFIVTDNTAAQLYLDRLRTALNMPCEAFIAAPGEEHKNHATLLSIYEAMAECNFTRRDVVFALGGGTVTDMAGFAAATYMRGVRLVMCPTTIVAQADAAVGGKCAVNIGSGKNLVGAFKQPEMVIADTDTLATLPAREYASGMAEIVKCACIASSGLFEYIATGGDDMERLIYAACDIKRRYVERDELDMGERHMLNFGHTLGHAMERAGGFAITHGEAVAIGMVYAARLGEMLDVTQEGTEKKLIMVLEALGLPTRFEGDMNEVYNNLAFDKKADGSSIDAVLLRHIGSAVRVALKREEFKKVL